MPCKIKVIKVYNDFDEFEREIEKYNKGGYRPVDGARIAYSSTGSPNFYITMIKEESKDNKITLKQEDDGI